MLALGNESPEIVAEVLQCSQCAGKLSVAADGLVCFRCGDRIPVEDGIIDFVRGSSRTKLDDIDYDAFYRVNKDASLAQASTLIDQAGAWWPTTLGRTLEVGAGTGGIFVRPNGVAGTDWRLPADQMSTSRYFNTSAFGMPVAVPHIAEKTR